MKIKKSTYTKITSPEWAEDLLEEALRLMIRHGFYDRAIEILSKHFLKILRPLMDENILGGQNCTVAEFIALRIDELETFLAEIYDGDDVELITNAEVTVKFWQFIDLIMKCAALPAGKRKDVFIDSIDWNKLEELVPGEYVDQAFYSGFLVLILTLQKWLRTWVEDGEILSQVVDFRTL